MQLSFSELKDLIFNVGLGAGLPVGICEDISFSVATLESFSLNGTGEFLYVLDCDRTSNKNYCFEEDELGINSGSVLFEGVSAIDFFIAEKVSKIVFRNLDSPMLLLGLGFNYTSSQFIMSSEGRIIGGLYESKLFWDKGFKSRKGNVTLTKANKKFSRTIAQKDRISLSQSTLKKLNSISSRMLVPESDESREKGAGAGISDND